MVFHSTDSGPFYLSSEEKEQRRYDRFLSTSTTKTKTKRDFRKDLLSAGVTLPPERQMHLADYHALAQQHGIETTIEKKKIIPGWEGKSKGILQILWECGLIVENDYRHMTLDGRKDHLTGEVDVSNSLRYLLSQCADFKNELSTLQALGKDIGIVVNSTPKYHAELASEGIEYSWDTQKGCIIRQLYEKNRAEVISFGL